MKSKQLLCLLSMIVTLSSPYATAQAWSGILNSSRAANWQRANVGVPGGIPSATWTQCGATIAAYGTVGSPASPATINNAIAACGANQYVLLGPGTFYLNDSPRITQSNVVLRGSGPTSTTLALGGSSWAGYGGSFSGSIYVGGLQIGSDNFRVQPPCGGSGSTNCGTWGGGFSQGATSITISGVGSTGILNGDMIILDQQGDVADTGGYLTCENTSPLFCMAQNAVEGRVISGTYWVEEQFVRVVSGCSSACNGSGPYTITISPGLYANNWNQGDGAGKTGVWFTKPISKVGIENMTVDDTTCPDAINCESGVTFFDVDGGWVKNVIILNTRRNHIWLANSSHMEVRDSYLYGTKNGESQSYGVEFFPAGDSLVENNIFQQVASPIMFGGGAGNVIGYNFSIDNVYGPPSFSQGSYVSHSGGNYLNLFEGNIFNELITDQLHGTSGLSTAFRNWLNGLDWNTCTYNAPGCSDTNNFANHPNIQTQPFSLASYARGVNIIGNVLGTPGYHVAYQFATPAVPSSTTVCNQAIYTFGYSNGPPICNIGGNGGVADDLMVASTGMRWGNYDVVNKAPQWSNTESSPGAVMYIAAQTTPANHNLPASLYLSGTPSWWGTMAFPPIGPDVIGGNGGTYPSGTYAQGICPVGNVAGGATCTSSLGGFANVNPAMNCYFNVLNGRPDGSGSALGFDANSCYSNPLLPNPPTALNAVVQ
jgi:Right handed beta helix region